jgi:hypothetical protein
MHPFLLYPAASKDKHKEIDIQVSAIGEDSVGVLELQSPWLPPGFAGMLHELQHHDSKPMTVRQVAVTSWHLYPNIAILFSTSIVVFAMDWVLLQLWPPPGSHTAATLALFVGWLHLHHALFWHKWWPLVRSNDVLGFQWEIHSGDYTHMQLYSKCNQNCLGELLRVCTGHAIHEMCVDLTPEQELIQFPGIPVVQSSSFYIGLGASRNQRRGECQDMAMGLWAGQQAPHQGPRKTLRLQKQ